MLKRMYICLISQIWLKMYNRSCNKNIYAYLRYPEKNIQLKVVGDQNMTEKKVNLADSTL